MDFSLQLRECLSNRPKRRVNQTPFLSLSCDISLIDNLCGKVIVLKLAVRRVITIYGLKRAGHRATHSTGLRKMQPQNQEHWDSLGEVGVCAANCNSLL